MKIDNIMMNLRHYIYNNHWTIGFIEEPVADIVSGKQYSVHWMKNPYRNRWFADPFILDVTDKEIKVLVEEFYDPIHRGRISKLIVNRDSYKLVEIVPFLELPTHLSFPAIKRVGDKVFIYPENGNASTLKLYQYNPATDECKEVKTLSNDPLADAIWTEMFGEELIFSTHQPTHNGSELGVYRIDGDLFKENELISFSANIARNAGDWFKIGNKVYRPAQDCTKRYGGAVILQEVIKSGSAFEFKNVCRIEHTYKNYRLGCHTFNNYKGLSVIDVNGYRRPNMANLMAKVTEIKKILLHVS